MKKKKKSLADWSDAIENALDSHGPYWHNIVSVCLGAAAKDYGNKAANELIDKHNLAILGWKKEPETK